MPQRYQLFLGSVALLGLSSWLLGPDLTGVQDDALEADGVAFSSAMFPHLAPRLLLSDEASAVGSQGTGVPLTVHLTGNSDEFFNPAMSIFKTDIFQRYGTGRIELTVMETAGCDDNDTCEEPAEMDEGPCLAVSRNRECPINLLKCNYPTCKTMVTNNEYCQSPQYDVREYYSAYLSTRAYLPLGPRFDSWTSFQKLRSNPGFVTKKASERKYAFNAVFSQNTNKGRRQLAQILRNTPTDLEVFHSMAMRWAFDPNDPHNALLDTDSYAAVALDSVFTLSPAGHNPECFRLFEAVEAGSIPIMVKGDLHQMRPCRQGLVHWHDAPIVVLGSWHELYSTVETLMADPAALDEMQSKLGEWYDAYWKERVREFEDYMLDAYDLPKDEVEHGASVLVERTLVGPEEVEEPSEEPPPRKIHPAMQARHDRIMRNQRRKALVRESRYQRMWRNRRNHH